MAKGLLDLANSLERRSKGVTEQSSQAAIKATRTMLYELVFKTPVDTSKALSNWQVSLNAPVETSIAAHYKGEGGSTRSSSAGEAIKKADLILKSKKPGDVIYLSNIVPYIKRLNDHGHSKQHAGGFVEIAVKLGRKKLQGAFINF